MNGYDMSTAKYVFFFFALVVAAILKIADSLLLSRNIKKEQKDGPFEGEIVMKTGKISLIANFLLFLDFLVASATDLAASSLFTVIFLLLSLGSLYLFINDLIWSCTVTDETFTIRQLSKTKEYDLADIKIATSLGHSKSRSGGMRLVMNNGDKVYFSQGYVGLYTFEYRADERRREKRYRKG